MNITKNFEQEYRNGIVADYIQPDGQLVRRRAYSTETVSVFNAITMSRSQLHNVVRDNKQR